jgi:hypothetical protein
MFLSPYAEYFLIILNGGNDIIRRCLDIDLVEGANENQAQRRDWAWLAARVVQGRIVYVSGVMARGDLLDLDQLTRGAHEPRIRRPR